MIRIRYVAGLLALALVGLPLLVSPSSLTGALAAAAAALCLGGIVRLSVPLLTAGASLSLLEYLLALLQSAGPPDFVVAVALGVTLALLFEIVGFAARFRGVAMDPRVLRDQIRLWIGTGAVGAAVGIVMATGLAGFVLDLPPAAYPAAAALGILTAFLGVVRVAMQKADRPQSDRTDGIQ